MRTPAFLIGLIGVCGLALVTQAGAQAQYLGTPYGGYPYMVYSPGVGGDVLLQNGFGGYNATPWVPFGLYNSGPSYSPLGYGMDQGYFGTENGYAGAPNQYFGDVPAQSAQQMTAVESGEAAAPASAPTPTVSGPIPRTNDTISAVLLAGNRLRMDWSGDPTAVSSIYFALLDRNQNPIVGSTISTLPATMTLHRTAKTAYYEVRVTYVNGTTNTVVAPVAAYFQPTPSH
jgi:hypothetical protein